MSHAMTGKTSAAIGGWVTIGSVVALFASPVVVLAWSLLEPDTDVWAQLWRTRCQG